MMYVSRCLLFRPRNIIMTNNYGKDLNKTDRPPGRLI